MGQSIGSLFPLRWRLWLGNLLFRPLGPITYRVSWHGVIKGPCDPTEIEAMNYVAAHTTVPVPGRISSSFSNPHVRTKGSTPSVEWLRKRAGLLSVDLWSLALARGNYDTTV